ncbi:RNA-binding S4 domain-containing protein [Parahalioglobus pacificus]|uniref:Heat shock protein 15 n=1 Tax=Parahalioglobus pacificus TaxID=930806 RepID=A0A918XMB5_9GAMM|nr:S4 domain-containing protein [Halioglobus pacificus]GHD39332.1 heat shock protein 15 [Halioglobus pacificus]
MNEKLRIDKWLWAARFFKTRSLAKAAIEGGKVQVGGQRVKVSKEIMVGDQLRVRQGWDEKDIVIVALSDQRRGAPEASQLYQETDESIARREAEAVARKAAGGMIERPMKRPSKRERRQIHRFRELPKD